MTLDSVLDIGCGLGTWLSMFKELGVSQIAGTDGNYVNKEKLYISEDCFTPFDLTKPFNFGNRYDLAVTLEVAEHLPKKCARQFVDSLCLHSDLILFSAAAPGQGGTNHINEAYPSYWAQLFKGNDYYPIDCIRNTIWTDNSILKHYRQNILFFSNKNSIIYQKYHGTDHGPLDIVHPEMLLKATSIPSLKALLKIQLMVFKKFPSYFAAALSRKMKRFN